MKFMLHLIFMMILAGIMSAQTLPERHKLSDTTYSFSRWSSESEAASYPPNMMFHTAGSMDPDLNDEMTGDWELPYNLTSGSRLTGMNDDGISFLNTSVKNDNSGFLGAAVVGLNTINCKNIRVDWTGRTINPDDRVYSIALQYKIGDGDYENTGVVYLMGSNAGSNTKFNDVKLPEICENRDSVYLRWKYYFTSNDAGARAELGLDDILIKADIYSDIKVKKAKEQIYFKHYRNEILIDADNNFADIFEIRIYNISGNLIFNANSHLPFRYDMSNLSKGFYFINLYNPYHSKSFMFVK